MTRPSITPHEDAFRQSIKQRPAPANELQAAVFRIVEASSLEYARAMDDGRGQKACFNICVSSCASMIATLCYSTTSTENGADDKAAGMMMAFVLAELANTLGAKPVVETNVKVDQTRPVRA